MCKSNFLKAGDRVSFKGFGRWMVIAIRDGYLYLSRRCRDGSIENWKCLETRRFI